MCSQQSKGAKYPQKSFNCADTFSLKITRFHAALKPIFRSLKPFQAFSRLLNLGARDFSFYMNTHIQPQKEPLEEVWKSAGIDGTEMVLNVHIPKGADLDTGAVRQSYVRALDFWGCGSAVLLCESWLLSPQLGELLPQKSRIRSFAKEFSVIAVEESSRQAEERIFGAVKADPRDYPENGTSLQLAARRHLITGGSLPAGFGWQKIVKP